MVEKASTQPMAFELTPNRVGIRASKGVQEIEQKWSFPSLPGKIMTYVGGFLFFFSLSQTLLFKWSWRLLRGLTGKLSKEHSCPKQGREHWAGNIFNNWKLFFQVECYLVLWHKTWTRAMSRVSSQGKYSSLFPELWSSSKKLPFEDRQSHVAPCCHGVTQTHDA